MLRKKVRRVKRINSRYVNRPNSLVFNWGTSTPPEWYRPEHGRLFNNFRSVALASNKLQTFEALKDVEGISIPEFTTDREQALQWVRDGCKVLARTRLDANSGQGIVVCTDVEDVPERCPLFVKYIKKRHEYRVHVAFGRIDVQQKRRRADRGDYNVIPEIRNLDNGWVFCREGVVEPPGLRELAVASVRGLGLDWGACDIIWNERANQCYLLEVNTAPGLAGATLTHYADAFLDVINNERH